jgi:hypothetical protein
MKLQFRAEVYNLTNSENFGQPNINIGGFDAAGHPTNANSFGQITASNLALNPRQYQFALKLIF